MKGKVRAEGNKEEKCFISTSPTCKQGVILSRLRPKSLLGTGRNTGEKSSIRKLVILTRSRISQISDVVSTTDVLLEMNAVE